MSLTFIARAADDDGSALELAGEIAERHDCASVFVYEPLPTGEERLVGEIRRDDLAAVRRRASSGASVGA